MKIINAIGSFIKSTFQFFFSFRKFFLAIPVVYGAYLQAKHNLEALPLQVGLILEASGTYSKIITRDQAVFYPLVITGICLVCMFCSRKVFYPWLVSVITLAIPSLLLLLNQLFSLV